MELLGYLGMIFIVQAASEEPMDDFGKDKACSEVASYLYSIQYQRGYIFNMYQHPLKYL